ncbi:MAG: transcription antitermination factor NusB [bacterium]
MGLRRRSREKALQIMYSMEFQHSENPDKAMDLYFKYLDLTLPDLEKDKAEEERNFICYLIHQYFDNKKEVEELINKASINWRISRIAYIERNILRLSVSELLDKENDVPYKATINEAIDIAKKFCNIESPSFVNGIVNKIADISDVKSIKT